MALGMKPEWGSQLNKAFAYILKSSPNFIYARTKYHELKCKDLTKNVCEGDVLKKAAAVREFNNFTKVDVLSKKKQDKIGECLGKPKLPPSKSIAK